jgi:hypothetical protein
MHNKTNHFFGITHFLVKYDIIINLKIYIFNICDIKRIFFIFVSVKFVDKKLKLFYI